MNGFCPKPESPGIPRTSTFTLYAFPKNKLPDAVMENLDPCILQFQYGLHPGHNLRKTAGKSQPHWPTSQLWFGNGSQRDRNPCVLLSLPSPRHALLQCTPVWSLCSQGSLSSHLQSDSSEEKEEGERKTLCSRLLRTVIEDLTVQSLRTALYLSPTASFQAGNPGTREQHQTENPGLEDNMANYSGL